MTFSQTSDGNRCNIYYMHEYELFLTTVMDMASCIYNDVMGNLPNDVFIHMVTQKDAITKINN